MRRASITGMVPWPECYRHASTDVGCMAPDRRFSLGKGPFKALYVTAFVASAVEKYAELLFEQIVEHPCTAGHIRNPVCRKFDEPASSTRATDAVNRLTHPGPYMKRREPMLAQ